MPELDPGMRALGMIETKGLVACIEAADAMASGHAPSQPAAIGGFTAVIVGPMSAQCGQLEASSAHGWRSGPVRICPARISA
jgi:hypothetical protein